MMIPPYLRQSIPFLLVAAAAPLSQAATILDTTSSKTATLGLPATSSSLATGAKGWTFSVDSEWTIDSVSWGLYGNSAGTANVGVRLFSGSTATGTPLADSGTSSVSLNQISTANYYDWLNLDWSLTAGTYTIAAYGSAVNTTPRVATTAVAPVTSPGFTALSATQSDNNYSVFVQGSPSSQDISAIPEPSSSLGTLGILAAGMMIRRRSKKAA